MHGREGGREGGRGRERERERERQRERQREREREIETETQRDGGRWREEAGRPSDIQTGREGRRTGGREFRGHDAETPVCTANIDDDGDDYEMVCWVKHRLNANFIG